MQNDDKGEIVGFEGPASPSLSEASIAELLLACFPLFFPLASKLISGGVAQFILAWLPACGGDKMNERQR